MGDLIADEVELEAPGAEVDSEDQHDEQLDEGGESDPDAGQGDGTTAESDGSEVVVTIGDEEPSEDEPENRAPDWVRELRKSNREKDRKLREQEAEISRLKGGAPAAVVVGDKPTLEGCDFESEKFERELEAWHERKRKLDDEQRRRNEAEAAAKSAWDSKLADYGKAKAALKVADFEDAEDTARDMFSVTQQGVILNGAENAALVVYALGKNPKKAKELAAITDPVKFAFAVAKLETQLKVKPRKAAPQPERTVQASVAGAAAVDNTLARLRAEAEKTGDYTKVHAYKTSKRK